MKKIIYKSVGTYLNTLASIHSERAGKRGYKLFCSPVRTKVKPHHYDFLAPAKYKTIHSQEHPIQLYKWGSGDRHVLFLHGWQSHTFRWKKYIQAFPMDEYTIYGMDAPAHGLSGGNMVNAIIYAEAITDVLSEISHAETIIGHSFGGFSAMYALHKHPYLSVQKVALLGTPGKATEFFDTGKKLLGLKTKADQAIRQHFFKLYGQDINDFETINFIDNIDAKGLIIHDKNDREADFEYATKLSQEWHNSIFIPTEGLGHKLYSDQIVRHLLDFVESDHVSI